MSMFLSRKELFVCCGHITILKDKETCMFAQCIIKSCNVYVRP